MGLIIGKGGETIRFLQQQSGAKVQVAKREIGETGIRNVFVEGTQEKFDHAKRLIQAIIDEHRKNATQKANSNLLTVQFPIPNNLTGLIIGKNRIYVRCFRKGRRNA